MELMQAIRERRAVREYAPIHIERSSIERLIQAAVLAPSARNLQPWAFAALLDREGIESYGKRATSWLLANFPQTHFDDALRKMVEDPDFVMFYHAPALVLVLGKSSNRQAAEDCCLAAENLLLAARAEGLGTCWIGLARPWLNLPATKVELKVPESYHVVAPIVLGQPKAWPESHGRNPAEIYWLDEEFGEKP